MFALPYILALLFLIGFVMFICGWDGAKIVFALVAIAVFGVELFIAACIHLVTYHFVTGNFTHNQWAAFLPVVFLAIVWTVHYHQLKPQR
jgi:hypothetical protein